MIGTFFIARKHMDDLTHAILLSILSPVLYHPLSILIWILCGLIVSAPIYFMKEVGFRISREEAVHIVGFMTMIIAGTCVYLLRHVLEYDRTHGSDGKGRSSDSIRS